jgi:Fe-S oxidoreductase
MIILQEVMDGSLELDEQLMETLFQCTTCANCSTNCASGVEVPEIIKLARKDMVGLGICHPAFSAMDKVLDQYPNIYGQKSGENFGRTLNRKAQYVLYIGCVGRFRDEEATVATLDLLDHMDVDYTLIDEFCCSGVLEDIGYNIKVPLAKKNIENILATGAKTVITTCPYCMKTFRDKAAYQALVKSGIEVIHISQLLAGMKFNVRTDLKVTYHDPCDLGRHCGIYEEPRHTIKKLASNFIELPANRDESNCCGSGGGVRGAFPRNSIAMARRRLSEVEEVGADVLLTECNSCRHNLSNAKLRKQKFEIYTTSQFINELLEGKIR